MGILIDVKPAKPRKGAPSKSAAARKAAAGTPAAEASADGAAPSPRRTQLEKELRAAIGQVDEKGLVFLLRQAQVLIHNARVESLQQSSSPESENTGPLPVAAGRPDTVSIERPEGGKAIFLTLGRVRKVMSPQEMKRLVRICYGAPTRSEAVRHLFTVLLRERKDILTDAVIGGPDSPLIIGLFNAVRDTYQLEDR